MNDDYVPCRFNDQECKWYSCDDCIHNPANKKKILHLTLKKKWFDQIMEGKKKVEYREIKPYWTKRLCNPDGTYKHFDYIIFKNGYSKTVPWIIVKHEGMSQGYYSEWDKRVYCIALGEVLQRGDKVDE